MLALLPWVALAALVLAFRRRGHAYGSALVAGLVWWSALLALSSEVLSLGHALTRPGVAVCWLLLAAAATSWALRSHGGTLVARASSAWPERALAIGVALLLVTVLSTTLLVQVHCQDVMSYHLARVLHWAQGASLEPFPTHDSRQLYHPPFAELVDLHFLLLSKGDRWVAPARVLFLAGAAVAAAEVARRLAPEGWRFAAVGAAAVAVSAPLTLGSVLVGKNDPVAGFFLVALVLALLAARERPGWAVALRAGLALGLALLTKTTSFFFAPPFVALLGGALVLRHGRNAWRPALALVALPPLLMAGHMARNLRIYGHPVADPARLEGLSVEGKGPAAALSNVLRFSSAHLGGPWPSWNERVERCVRQAHGWLRLDPDDPRTTLGGQRFVVQNSFRLDVYAGSPAHFLLGLIAVGLVASRSVLRREPTRVLHALALAGAALLMLASLRWAFAASRLESPLFLLAAPLIGVALAGRAWVSALYATLLLAALPWIVCANGRGVVGPSSVLAVPRRELLFAADRELQEPAEQAAAWIGARRYHDVGVQPEERLFAEYPLWVTLKEHVPGLRLEHVNATGATAAPASWPAYRDFVPDVVLRIRSPDPARRKPLEPLLKVGKQPYALKYQVERLAVYERFERERPTRNAGGGPADIQR